LILVWVLVFSPDFSWNSKNAFESLKAKMAKQTHLIPSQAQRCFAFLSESLNLHTQILYILHYIFKISCKARCKTENNGLNLFLKTGGNCFFLGRQLTSIVTILETTRVQFSTPGEGFLDLAQVPWTGEGIFPRVSHSLPSRQDYGQGFQKLLTVHSSPSGDGLRHKCLL
jgi:hypothetical protein